MVIFGMFRHMNYVYEVYREGSFSKAAAKLYISQPALSATVKKVETEIVPLKLFEEEPFVLLRSHNDTRERAERIPVLPQKQIFYQIHGGIHEACRRGAGARLVLEEMKKWEKVQQLRRNTPGASMSAT